MAVVTRAVVDGPKSFECEVALKRILRSFSQQPSFIRMLATEARLTARLTHSGIAQIHDFGEVDGEYFLAMELVDGINLIELIRLCRHRRRVPPVGVVAYVIGQVAGALAYAHSLCDDDGTPLGIVHRDISPSNIMVTRVGSVKLLDFGIAKVAETLRDGQTRTGPNEIKGKLSYLSPEQSVGGELDGRSDMFSLGIVFHELLTLQKLFPWKASDDPAVLLRDAQIQPPSALVSGIPPEVDDVVMRMLAIDRRHRFADCKELVAALAGVTRRFRGDVAALQRFMKELRSSAAVAPSRRAAVGAVAGETPTEEAPLRRRASATRTELARALSAAESEVDGSRALWGAVTAAAVAAAAICGLAVVPLPQLAPARPRAAPIVATPAAAPLPAHKEANVVYNPLPVASALVRRAPPSMRRGGDDDQVRLSLTGTLAASVFVDGKRIGTMPLQTLLPSRSVPRSIVVSRRGYAPWTREIDGQGDTALVVVLERDHQPTLPLEANPWRPKR